MNNYFTIFNNQNCSNSLCGITSDGVRVTLPKEMFGTLPDEIKEAFINLGAMKLSDFHSFVKRKDNYIQLQRTIGIDFFTLLFPHLSETTKDVLFLTCHHFKQAVGPRNLKGICEHAAREGDLRILKWARASGFRGQSSYKLAVIANEQGHRETANWLGFHSFVNRKDNHFQLYRTLGIDVFHQIVRHLPETTKDVLFLTCHHFRQVVGSRNLRRICEHAAIEGDLKILKWALASGFIGRPSSELAFLATRQGHIETANWLNSIDPNRMSFLHVVDIAIRNQTVKKN
jgi:hypothetical protein